MEVLLLLLLALHNAWNTARHASCISPCLRLASPCVPELVWGLLVDRLLWVHCFSVRVGAIVTIRQRAESLSVRVGADHFLVSHHPGCGVIHLGTEVADGQRHRHKQSRHRKVQHTHKHGAEADAQYVVFVRCRVLLLCLPPFFVSCRVFFCANVSLKVFIVRAHS